MTAERPTRKTFAAAQGNSLLLAFQDALECLQREMGLSRNAFADRLGIPRSSCFHLMTAEANPTLNYVELIAERLGVDPITLLAKVTTRGGPGRSASQEARPLC
jgi:hypothetical protein